jgi:AraC-like DNA-binding protein
MTKPPAASEQSVVTVVDIDDPTVANTGIELLDMNAVQLHSMPMRVRRVVIRLESAAIIYHSANVRVRTRTSVRMGLLGYVTFGPHTNGSSNGLPVRPGLMLAAAPGAQSTFVTNPGWEGIAFLLPPGDIRAHLTARQRENDFHMPNGVEPLQVDAARVGALYDWGKRLVDAVVQKPSLFDEQARRRLAAQDELLEMLLATLHVANDFETTRSDRKRQARDRIVRVAEEYALAHSGERLYVSDLCRAAAVSERTLEYAFKGVAGLTPLKYLLRLRLHRVRQALLAATPRSTKVSVEALNWGFWHFGEFSRAYKECFGEPPSETLRRRP